MPSEPDLARVNYDDLEFDDQLALLNGVPFTGIVFSLYTDGKLESESRYAAGLPDGLQEEWYADGKLARRNIAVRGKGSSESWSWHANGVLRSHRRNVDLMPVEVRAWDERGRPADVSTVD